MLQNGCVVKPEVIELPKYLFDQYWILCYFASLFIKELDRFDVKLNYFCCRDHFLELLYDFLFIPIGAHSI